jgi:hypothetical protein
MDDALIGNVCCSVQLWLFTLRGWIMPRPEQRSYVSLLPFLLTLTMTDVSNSAEHNPLCYVTRSKINIVHVTVYEWAHARVHIIVATKMTSHLTIVFLVFPW